METRNILDQFGNIIGVVTLPSSTSEEVWAEKTLCYIVEEQVEEPEV